MPCKPVIASSAHASPTGLSCRCERAPGEPVVAGIEAASPALGLPEPRAQVRARARPPLQPPAARTGAPALRHERRARPIVSGAGSLPNP